jgi:hypothetical protein
MFQNYYFLILGVKYLLKTMKTINIMFQNYYFMLFRGLKTFLKPLKHLTLGFKTIILCFLGDKNLFKTIKIIIIRFQNYYFILFRL